MPYDRYGPRHRTPAEELAYRAAKEMNKWKKRTGVNLEAPDKSAPMFTDDIPEFAGDPRRRQRIRKIIRNFVKSI